jgi:hypothetical protein
LWRLAEQSYFNMFARSFAPSLHSREICCSAKTIGVYFPMSSILRTLPAYTGGLGQHAAAQKAVLLCLQDNKSEMSPRELVDRVRTNSPHLKDLDIKRAVWRLIKEGELEFSPGRRLTARRERRVDADEEEDVSPFIVAVSGEAAPSPEQQFQTAKGAA